MSNTPSQNSSFVPLSFGQERLWFVDRFSPGLSTYNMPVSMRLKGDLNVEILYKTLNTIVARHESLRMSFHTVDGQPSLHIREQIDIEPQLSDLSSLPEDERDQQSLRLADEIYTTPFDLEKGPLFRASLIKLSDQEHILVTVRHHIISDGWSNGIFLKEFGTLYASLIQEKPSPLPPLSFDYSQFAIRQRQELQGELLEKELAFWKETLNEAPTSLQLPTDHPRPSVQTFNGARVAFSIDAATVSALKLLARKERATPFMILMTAWNILLHRYSGQDDIVVGTPVSGRNRAELEPIIGFFVNTLPVRTRLHDNPDFPELLHRVRNAMLNANEHQNLPLEKVIQELDIPRDTGRSPLFQVLLALQNTHSSSLALPGLEISRIENESVTSKFDITLNMRAEGEELKGWLEYNVDLFEATSMERMTTHFRKLLQEIAANPARNIAEIPLMDEYETQQVVCEWNATGTDYPRDRWIHQLFEVQAEQRPEAVALVLDDQQLSYGELNRKANRLARHLRDIGVKGDDFVCISMERSIDLVVGLLAILKAGGAYVPLDPDYPDERLQFMLEDTGAGVLLTSGKLTDRFAACACAILRMDDDLVSIDAHDDGNLSDIDKPKQLAYVVYTSGSTGIPKGTVIPHCGVVRLVLNTNYVTLDADQTLLHMASISFDASTFEVWGALLTGGRCVLCPDKIPTPEQIGNLITKHHVTTAWLTSALFNMVIDEKAEVLSALSQLLIGGEALSPSHVRKAERMLCSTKIINGYGPTENTTFTCCYPISGNMHDGMISIPIGRPISNTQVYILDQRMAPCPIGIPGELYIGGDGLAVGYLNNPEMTAERFVANPFSSEADARLYKTGDLVRFLAGGDIEFIGRFDHQVKIRGFRIEPGEIESILKQLPHIKEAAVIVREDTPGSKQLVAYVVADNHAHQELSELRYHVSTHLPDYMVPSAFVELDKLPLTGNGKVDRKSLPEPDRNSYSEAVTYVEPRNHTEKCLAEIWESLLNVKPVGVRDNFFDLGGHSLLAVRMITRIKEQFGTDLPLATLFQAPTIEHLAEALNQNDLDALWSSLVPIQNAGDKPPLFFIHGAGGNVMMFQSLSAHLGTNQPFFGLQARGLDGKTTPLESIEEMATTYIQEIRKIQPTGPYHLGGMCMGGIVAYEMAQQLNSIGEEVALVALIDSANPPAMMPTTGQANRQSLTKKTGTHLKQNTLFKALRRKAGNKSRKMKRQLLRMLRKLVNPFIKPERRYYKNIWKANEKARHAYLALPYDGRVISFLAADKGEWAPTDPRWVWNKLVTRGLETFWVPAQHDTLLQEPHVRSIAEQLKQCIQQSAPE